MLNNFHGAGTPNHNHRKRQICFEIGKKTKHTGRDEQQLVELDADDDDEDEDGLEFEDDDGEYEDR